MRGAGAPSAARITRSVGRTVPDSLRSVGKDRLEIFRAVSAQRAEEVLRKHRTFIDVAADPAPEAFDRSLLLCFLLLRLYVILVIRISERSLLTEDLRIHDLGDEHRVRPEIKTVHDLAAYDRAGLPREIRNAVHILRKAKVLELIHISSGLEAEMLNQLKSGSPQQIIEGIKQSVKDFVGDAPQFDDMTMVCTELTEEKPKMLIVDAKGENLEKVNDFVHQHLEGEECSFKTLNEIDLAVEEIFVNIASYAYGDGEGTAEIILNKNNNEISLTFKDRGIPYDPLKKEDPNTKLSAAERQIGGLGIFLVKKVMDSTAYEYTDGYNVFTMTKKLK